MSLITWTKEQYGTGVNICDDEHKILFDRLNALHDSVPGGDKVIIGEKLDALIAYVVEHFTAEEKLMQEKGYDGYPDHKKLHDKLIGTCGDLQKKFHAGETEINAESTAFVKDWLDHHIPNIDRKYESVLNS